MKIVGMSGGVDSSVTALLMKQRGEDILGVYMHNWDSQDPACRGEQDRRDALRVCGALGLPFKVLDFSAEYRQQVFAEFLEDYRRGLTPNPDILCNREIKFQAFLNAALELGAESIATGHYARREWLADGSAGLFRAKDPKKDQSYFLQAISQSALRRAEFPLGNLEKTEVRRLAEEANLVTAAKRDSTGICFIGERDFQEFLSQYIPAKAGDIVDEDGRVIGKHKGACYYTVGQRAPVGGVKGKADQPWFILAKDVQQNRLIVAQGHNHPKLLTQVFMVDRLSWIAGHAPARVWDAEVQIRHLGEAHKATVELLDDQHARVTLAKPIRAVAAGQAAAFYQGDRCFGGSFISPMQEA